MKDSDLIFGLMASLGKEQYSIQDLIYLIKPFNITENSLRTNLSRMKSNAILKVNKKGKTVYYKFHTRGKKMNAIAELSFRPPIWDRWNNTWFGVVFTVSDNNKEERYKLRKRLIAYRFAPQYPGFWIRPFHQVENEKYNFGNIFESKYSRLIQLNFSIIPGTKEIQKLWNIDQINKEYYNGIAKLDRKIKNSSELIPIEALKVKMYLGNEMVKLIFKDPLLPPKFLPENWKGNELREKFYELDKKLTDISKPYWNKIFTKLKYS